jgi:hypothetical protein
MPIPMYGESDATYPNEVRHETRGVNAHRKHLERLDANRERGRERVAVVAFVFGERIGLEHRTFRYHSSMGGP